MAADGGSVGYQMVNRQGDAVPQPSGAAWRAHDGWFVDRILTTQAAVLIPTLLVPEELGMFLRRALRHGAVGEMVRVAGVFTRW
jgi:hypothetical protein